MGAWAGLTAGIHDTAVRRWRLLLLAAVVAVLLAAPVTIGLGWLFPPSGGLAVVLVFGVGLWLALTAAGGLVVLLVDHRPGRRAALGAVGAVVLLLACLVPAGSFWTFAVDHGPTGQQCPECAVVEYFGAGPLGGFGREELAFDRVLCAASRGRLREQTEGMARDIARATEGRGVRFFEAQTSGLQAAVDGDQATVTVQVSLAFTYTERQPGGATFLQGSNHPWTFRLVKEDGWQVCAVDAPDSCAVVVRCDRPPSPVGPTPSPSGSPDPLGRIKEMLPCGPRDPFRDLHNCPTPSPTAT